MDETLFGIIATSLAVLFGVVACVQTLRLEDRNDSLESESDRADQAVRRSDSLMDERDDYRERYKVLRTRMKTFLEESR